MRYVSLHHHTTLSFMDGFGTPEQHIARTAELGMTAQAVTEHGNVSSHVRHEKAALKAGIKPLFGIELYTASEITRRKWHLTVLAENAVGYRNMSQLVTRSWDEGFYQWPTVYGPMLADHAAGLVVLSGCADSLLACTLLGGKGVDPHPPDYAAARRVALRFKELFGDAYYLEVQQFPELERTKTINAAWEELSRDTGIPLVATADVHYPMPDDNAMQVVLHAAGRGSGTVDAQEASWEYGIRLSHPVSDKQVLQRLRGTGLSKRAAEEAWANTELIAQRCTVTLPKMERLRFPVEPGKTSQDLMREWLRAGWRYRWAREPHMRANKEAYVKQLEYEIDIIQQKDFVDYFLMLSELVRWCKDNPRPVPVGPARGSAAASVLAWLLRITEVNPMLFPTMVFERFIDITREDMPDVDLDFSDEQRSRVRDHLMEVWGEDHVGSIGNFVRYRGKNAIVDVARVHNIPPYRAKIVKDLVIERSGGDSRFDASLEDTFEMFPQAHKVLEQHPELSKAIRLEGNYRGMSVHAAGLVVAKDPVTDVTAMYTRVVGKDKRKTSVIAYDKEDVEYLGMLKVDVLGLKTMGMIDIALGMLGMSLDDLYQIPLDEPDTLAAFKRGDVVGIFQFEGRATRLVNNDVSPDNFMELVDVNALSRPGPLFSGATHRYVDTKHGRIKPKLLHPIVDEITKWSHYQIIYQEQILRIVREVGGFPWTHAAAIRKIISKKKGEAAFNEMYQMFEDGAAERGIDKKLALEIWKDMVTSGTYAFNVAHSISYSMLGFWCMWLKVHHPTVFYAAQLQKTEKEEWPRLLRDAQEHDQHISPPALNRSGKTWSVAEKGTVLAGFSQIPGIGEATAEAILKHREEEGDFASWEELTAVKGIGPSTMSRIKAFAHSDDPFELNRTRRELDEVRDAIRRKEIPLQMPTHNSDQIPPDADNLRVRWVGKVRERNYQDYLENQRARTGEEYEEILARIKDQHLLTSCVLRGYDDGHEDVYLRWNRWAFPRFKQALEELQLNRDVVLVEGVKKKGFGIAIHVENMWVLSPDDDDEE